MTKIVFLIVLAGVLVSTVVCKPYWLSKNTFLAGFVNHEVLTLMSVILTVTLAAVANAHMSLNRIVARRFNGNEELKSAANNVKRQMKHNAWFIFWGFVVTIIVLLIKGMNTENDMIVAISNGVVVWTLFLFIMCMYDIYQVIFGIVELEMKIGLVSEENPSPKKPPKKPKNKKSTP